MMKKFMTKNPEKGTKTKKPKKSPDSPVDKSRISYKEASSDDEFATKNFMFSSDDDSDDDRRSRKSSKRKRKEKNSEKTKPKKSADLDNSTTNSNVDDNEDAEFDTNVSMDKSASGSDSESGSESDGSQGDSSSPSYRIQYILTRKEMTPKEWVSICEGMYTHEITRGSVWQQPDSEFFDPSTKPLEKFLIKWVHASYLHLSWETEKDLLEMVGSTAKKAIKKYRLREYYGTELFEDLSKGEFFPPNCMYVDRILDIDDAAVNIATIDHANAPLPPPKETLKVASVPSAAAVDAVGVDAEMDTTATAATTTTDSQGKGAEAVTVDGETKQAADSASTLEVVDMTEDAEGEEEGENNGAESDDDDDEDDEVDDSESEEDDSDDELVEWANNTAAASVSGKQQEKDVAADVEGASKGKAITIDDSSSTTTADAADSMYGKLVVTRNGKTFVKSRSGGDANNKGKKEKKEKREKKGGKSLTVKKAPVKRVKINEFLHGTECCWVTVKWEGLPYSDASFEDINDLIRLGVEYEQPLRAFYAREQLSPKSVISRTGSAGAGGGNSSNNTVRHNALRDPEVINNTAEQPLFLEGAKLRDFQWEGVRWLLFNWCQGRNSILADEMGLGKTIQTAAFLQMLKRHGNSSGPFLVVAPLSTLVNWQREITLWTDMDAVVYHGSTEDRDMIREFEFKYVNKKAAKDKALNTGYKIEVIITSPETCLIGDNKASSTGRMRRELSKIQWDVVVIDEAHKLKNFDSKISATLREEYSYNNTLLLTGTPLQNNTDELWTLLNFVAREEFGDREQFTAEFGELKTSTQLDALHGKLKPYLLRRVKDDVEKTVPPKVEVIIEIELTVTQKQYYRALYESKTDFLYKGGAKDGPNLTNLAMELRKCCNHPFLIKGAENELSKHFTGDSKLDIMVKTSGKLTLLDKLLPKLKADGHRVLIFSQFRIMLNIIEDYLELKHYTYERIDGSITGKKRQSAIDRYCKGSSTKGYAKDNELFCMLLSTRAGGVGINLTAADVVIIFDSDWNPQNDLQAQARAHRIGQTKEVKVYRLLTKKTYESVMFKAASIKLGLDYAVMHNMGGNTATDTSALQTTTGSVTKKGRGNKKEQCTAVAGITTERAENASNLSKKELENLLKHGAYDIFREETLGQGEAESNKFCEETIDQILSHSSVIVHNENAKSVVTNNCFSKASFVQNDANNTAVAIDDPEFWTKVVGLSEGDQAIYDGTSKRRCREMISSYKEPGMSFARMRESNKDGDSSDSDGDGDGDTQDRKRTKKDIIVPGEYNPVNLNALLTSLVSRGYGNWTAIRRDTKLKWTLADIAKGCRLCMLQLLYWSCLSQNVWSPATSGKKAISTTATTAAAAAASTDDNTNTDECAMDTADSNNNNTSTELGGHEDLSYLESHLRKYKACRLALAAYLRECASSAVAAAGSDAESTAPVVDEDGSVVETVPVEDTILSEAEAAFASIVTEERAAVTVTEKDAKEEASATTAATEVTSQPSAMDVSVDSITDPLNSSFASTGDEKETEVNTKPVLPTYMQYFDNVTGFDVLTNKKYAKLSAVVSSDAADGVAAQPQPLTDREQYAPLYALVSELKRLPAPADFSAWEKEKVVKIRTAARNKLLQCEDIFELFLAAKYIQSEMPVPESEPVTEPVSVSAEEKPAEEETAVVDTESAVTMDVQASSAVAEASAVTEGLDSDAMNLTESESAIPLSTVKTNILLNALFNSDYCKDGKNNMSHNVVIPPVTGVNVEAGSDSADATVAVADSITAATDNVVEPWINDMDRLLISTVFTVGWPEGKRKIAQVESIFQQHGYFKFEGPTDENENQGEVAENCEEGDAVVASKERAVNPAEKVYLNSKFLTKRAKDFAASLRSWNNPIIAVPVVVVEKKEKDNTAKMQAYDKKFIQNVIRTVQRLGRVHSVYDSLRAFCANKGKSDTVVVEGNTVILCDESPVKTTTTTTEAAVPDSATERPESQPDSAPAVAGTDGSQYLLTWEALTAECLANQPPQNLLYIDTSVERVKEIVSAIVECYHNPMQFTTAEAGTTAVTDDAVGSEDAVVPSASVSSSSPSSRAPSPAAATTSTTPAAVVQVGVLKGTALKTIEACLEKSAPMHQIRQVLAFYSEPDICTFVQKGCKGAGPNVPQSRRDTSIPVWWTTAHDVQLLKLSLHYGTGNNKKIIADNAVASAPCDFIMPPRMSNAEWCTVLTVKSVEKRLTAVLNAIPLPSHPTVAPDSPTSKVRTAPGPEKKVTHSSIMNKFSLAASSSGGGQNTSDPFKSRVFGVRPAWATALAPKPSATSTSIATTAESASVVAATPTSKDTAVTATATGAAVKVTYDVDSELAVINASQPTTASTTTATAAISGSSGSSSSVFSSRAATPTIPSTSATQLSATTPQSNASSAFFRTSPMSFDGEGSMLFRDLESNPPRFDEQTTTRGVAEERPIVPLFTMVKSSVTPAAVVAPSVAVTAPAATETVAVTVDLSANTTSAEPAVDLVAAARARLAATIPHSVSCDTLTEESDATMTSTDEVTVVSSNKNKTPSPAVKRPLGDVTAAGDATGDSAKKLKFESTAVSVSPTTSAPSSQVVDMTCDDDDDVNAVTATVTTTVTTTTDAASKTTGGSSNPGSATKAKKSAATAVTPAAKAKPTATGSSGKKGKKADAVAAAATPSKPVAGIMSFFKKV